MDVALVTIVVGSLYAADGTFRHVVGPEADVAA